MAETVNSALLINFHETLPSGRGDYRYDVLWALVCHWGVAIAPYVPGGSDFPVAVTVLCGSKSDERVADCDLRHL